MENLQCIWDDNTFALQDSEVKAYATSKLSHLSFSSFTMQQIKLYLTDFAFLFYSRLVELCFFLEIRQGLECERFQASGDMGGAMNAALIQGCLVNFLIAFRVE